MVMCLRVFGRGKERREKRESGKGSEKGRLEGGRRGQEEEEDRTRERNGKESIFFGYVKMGLRQRFYSFIQLLIVELMMFDLFY